MPDFLSIFPLLLWFIGVNGDGSDNPFNTSNFLFRPGHLTLPPMLILALEQSTPAAGIVLVRDGEDIASHEWHEARKRDQHLFAALPAVLETGDVTVEELDRISVGLGPGSFSGVRIAIAAASALALPDRRPIAGVSSAAALAWQTMQNSEATTVAVLGDARRQRLWMATYEHDAAAGALKPGLPLSLVPAEELTERLPEGSCIVSSDWERLEERLAPLAGEGWKVIAEPRYPSPIDVAQLAIQMPENELVSPLDPPEPLYLHPAVFVEPRFPAP
jgi:tRNA threonylcarbamoyladenosine biosynthesis protein TsaB